RLAMDLHGWRDGGDLPRAAPDVGDGSSELALAAAPRRAAPPVTGSAAMTRWGSSVSPWLRPTRSSARPTAGRSSSSWARRRRRGSCHRRSVSTAKPRGRLSHCCVELSEQDGGLAWAVLALEDGPKAGPVGDEGCGAPRRGSQRSSG